MLDFNKKRNPDLRVFVSYTTKDPAVTKEKLELVESRIKPVAKVFIDLLHNEKGTQIRVNNELCDSDIVLLLESPQYKSDWVQKEIDTAIKMRKHIIKLTIDELLNMEEDNVFGLFSNNRVKK